AFCSTHCFANLFAWFRDEPARPSRGGYANRLRIMAFASCKQSLALGPNCSSLLVVLQPNARSTFSYDRNSSFRQQPAPCRLSAVGNTLGGRILSADGLKCFTDEPEALWCFRICLSARIFGRGLFCGMAIRRGERFFGD